ncbi:MAG: CocE/NonD family hydrolase [Gemmatimonadales bacterium]
MISVVIAAAGAALLAGQQPAPRYDVYSTGIKMAEVTLGARPSIRRRDLAANRWLPPATDAAALVLPGALRNLVARMPSFRRIDWSAVDLLGWPDSGSVYQRDDALTATVGGRPVQATRWVQRDASRPLDLVIGAGNELLAAIDPSSDFVMVRPGYEAFTNVARWQDPAISQPRFGYRTLPTEMVPMRDGIRLATLVYLPDGPDAKGPFPVIFIRTPYGISGQIARGLQYPLRGYALVVQAARGTSYTDPAYRSEGEFQFVINEPRDGADALEWLVRQPWSNGNVCMQGGSYVGYTQWAASMARNPALKCLIPESSMGTVFSDQPYMGGSYVEGLAFYSLFMLEEKLLPGRTWNEVLHHRPLIDIDRFATGKKLPAWNAVLEHDTNDDYWKEQDWYRGTHPRNFSALMISGWWDDDFPGTESNWALMQRYGVGPQRLIIGPWKHGYNIDRTLNGYRFGSRALRDDLWLEKQRWYDHILLGRDTQREAPKATYFVLGSNTWRTASDWPPPEAQPMKWYLQSEGDAARLASVGRLTTEPPAGDQPPDRYRYDPMNPPPNWMSFDQMLRWEDVQSFPYDMKDIEARPDVAVFTSAPLEQDLTIAGELTAVLYASTDVKDTDWWVHVSDVDDRGGSHRITQGMIRARFRKNDDPQHHIFGSNFEREALLSGNPDEVVRYEVGIRSIANTFKRGHRIRVAVMNAVDNYSFPNSNTGGREALVTETVIGNMAIQHTRQYPSHVVLPVLR